MPAAGAPGPVAPGAAGSARPRIHRANRDIGKATLIFAATALALLAAVFGAAVPVLGAIVPLGVLLMAVMVWILLDFRVGVAVSMVMMPLSPLSVFPHEMLGIRGMNPLNLMLFLTLISYVVHAGLKHWCDPLIPVRMLTWYLVPITIAAVVGMRYVGLIPPHFEAQKLIQFNDSIGYLRDYFIKPMFLVLMAVLVSLAVRHSKKPERFIYLMLISGWVFCGLIGSLMLTSGMSLRELASPLARDFLGKLGMHANEVSLLINMLYAVTLFSIRDQRTGWTRNVLFISAVMFAVCVLMTFSRGGFLGLMVITTMYFWKRLTIKTVVVGLLVAAAIGTFAAEALIERLMTGVEKGDRRAVMAGRLDDIWLPLLPYFLAEPVLPHGLQSILWSTPARMNRMLSVGQPHSAYLGGMMDLGIVGFGFVVAFLLFVRREFQRLAREHPSVGLHGVFAGGAVIIPVWFLQGLTDDRFTPTFAQVYFWITLGILMGCGGLFKHTSKALRTFAMPPLGPHAVTAAHVPGSGTAGTFQPTGARSDKSLDDTEGAVAT